MEKISILYYSGVGNTKTIAKRMNCYLKNKNDVDMYSIEELPKDFKFDIYSRVIIGFPTIHSAPASLMVDFIQKVNSTNKKIPVFVYTTCGLYSGNAIRIFCKLLICKNMIPVYTSSYRCPAVDGILLMPNIKQWYNYEKGLSFKIKKDLDQFIGMEKFIEKIPKFKWYSALNFPNKVFGQHMKFKIYLHKENCTSCGLCIKKCPVKACKNDENGIVLVDSDNCVNCYRCIHHCPQRALSLSKRKIPSKVLIH